MRSRLMMVGAVVLTLGSGASAQAATVSVTDQALRFAAGPGEVNLVTIDRDFTATVTVRDAGAPLVAGSGCAAIDAHAAACEASPETATDVALGDRDDRLTRLLAVADVSVQAGPGDDEVAGLWNFSVGGKAVLRGGSGDDRMNGAASMENEVYGESGDDELAHRARSGGLLDGGSGHDHLLHRSTFIGTLRGGSGDDVLVHDETGVELPAMDGGSGNDELRLALPGGPITYAAPVRGNAGSDRVVLTGQPSSVALSDRIDSDYDFTVRDDVEELRGTPGDDHILSDGTAHRILGGAGNDVIEGGGGDDKLFGEAGDDQVVGGSGRDDFDGGDGDDSLDARDGGADGSIACGSGIDAVAADPVDRLAQPGDCETFAAFRRI